MVAIHINSEHRKNGTAEDFSLPIIVGNSVGIANSHFLAVQQVTLPLTFYQVRNSVNSRFTFTFSNGSTKVVYVYIDNSSDQPMYEGNPSISSIINSIQTQINVNSSGQVFTVTVSTTTGKITFKSNTGGYSIDFNLDPFTKKVLGFLNSSYSSSVTGYLTSDATVCVTPVDSIYVKSNIQFTNGGDFDSKSLSISNVLCKISTIRQDVTAFGNLLYEPKFADFRQVNKLNDDVKFTLYYGDSNTPVSLNGQDWGLTLIYKGN